VQDVLFTNEAQWESAKRVKARKVGKLETMERLHLGHVPTDRVLELLERNNENPNEHASPRMVYRWKVAGYMQFDSADKLLVSAGLSPDAWWFDLGDIYWRINLGPHRGVASIYHPRNHGSKRMYLTGCRCAACDYIGKEGNRLSKHHKEAKLAA